MLEDIISSNLSIESKIDALYGITENILDKGAFRARTIRFKLNKYIQSSNPCEKIFALNTLF